jgi:hypothetical protein
MLVIQRHTQTVRAVEGRTGTERLVWLLFVCGRKCGALLYKELVEEQSDRWGLCSSGLLCSVHCYHHVLCDNPEELRSQTTANFVYKPTMCTICVCSTQDAWSV